MTTTPPTRQQIFYVEEAVTRLREIYLRAAGTMRNGDKRIDGMYAAAGDLRGMSDALRELRLQAEDERARVNR